MVRPRSETRSVEAPTLRASDAPLPESEIVAFAEHVNRELEEPFLPAILDGRHTADATFWAFRAFVHGRLVATAWSGFAKAFPSVAVLAGVVTSSRYRRRGLARRLCEEAVRRFRSRGEGALYLAAASEEAHRLYVRLGFKTIAGHAMVLETPGHDRLAGFASGLCVGSRPANWGDISRAVPLFLWPHDCVMADAASGFCSTRVAPPVRCVGIFWNIWRASVAAGGCWRVLENEVGTVVGSAVAAPTAGAMEADFVWHPHYEAEGRRFLRDFLDDAHARFGREVRILACEGDAWKKREAVRAGFAAERHSGRAAKIGNESRPLMTFSA